VCRGRLRRKHNSGRDGDVDSDSDGDERVTGMVRDVESDGGGLAC
jgi:hypothetical protein